MFSHIDNLNLLFIITDQQRYDAVGYINNIVQTPNIDKLASLSTVCHQAIVQSPQCQPSRASFLTGLYPDNIQMWWNETKLNPLLKTIGNYLSDHGYDTGYFGKLHIDGDLNYKQIANHYGFNNCYLSEDWLNLLQTSRDYATTVVRHEFYSPMNTDSDICLPQKRLAPWAGKLSSHELHHEDVIVKNAIRFIDQHKDQNGPYACFVSFHGPHPPYCSPPPYNDLYKYGDIPLPDILAPTWFGHQLSKMDWHHIKSQYYGAIAWIDNYIGQILERVNYSNTIVIFTSDHGDILGDHGFFSKGVFTYEGNIRVPLIIKHPSILPSDYNHSVQMIDLLPTLLSMMGIDLPNANGVDLSKALTNNSLVNQYAYSAIGTYPRHYMIRSTKYKYCIGSGQSFYDLSNDPNESVNIIGDHTYYDQVNLLRTQLMQHLSGFDNLFAQDASRKVQAAIHHTYYN